MTADPKRAGLRFVAALRLVSEQAAHGVSSGLLITFPKDIPGRPKPQSDIVAFRAKRIPVRGKKKRQNKIMEHDRAQA
jgi:hypothetical protein